MAILLFFLFLAHQQSYVPIPVLFSTVGRRASNGNNYMAQSTIPGPMTDSLSSAPLHYLL